MTNDKTQHVAAGTSAFQHRKDKSKDTGSKAKKSVKNPNSTTGKQITIRATQNDRDRAESIAAEISEIITESSGYDREVTVAVLIRSLLSMASDGKISPTVIAKYADKIAR